MSHSDKTPREVFQLKGSQLNIQVFSVRQFLPGPRSADAWPQSTACGSHAIAAPRHFHMRRESCEKPIEKQTGSEILTNLKLLFACWNHSDVHRSQLERLGQVGKSHMTFDGSCGVASLLSIKGGICENLDENLESCHPPPQ